VLQEAELICRMFEELGTNLLTKLEGRYSFCLYDAKLVRPLATCAPREPPLPCAAGTVCRRQHGWHVHRWCYAKVALCM
jgi:hypothetical protein